MESSSSSLSFCVPQMPPPVTTWTIRFSTIDYCWKRKRPSIQISAISYRKFIHFAFDEIKRHSHLVSSPLHLLPGYPVFKDTCILHAHARTTRVQGLSRFLLRFLKLC